LTSNVNDLCRNALFDRFC